ncbi:MAG: GPW/gp25 family protein [Holosporales bacterium]|jgi:predicted component of type VI protein secretion system|nr:GPW/gp25 family protein [Holosporales bacterium]
MSCKVDAPFLSKFNRRSAYIESTDELLQSIVEEVGNVLSAKLAIPGSHTAKDIYNSPFSYGVRDIQSIGISSGDLDNFKAHCRRAILAFDPRLLNVEIDNIAFDKCAQRLKMSMTFTINAPPTKLAAEILVT